MNTDNAILELFVIGFEDNNTTEYITFDVTYYNVIEVEFTDKIQSATWFASYENCKDFAEKIKKPTCYDGKKFTYVTPDYIYNNSDSIKILKIVAVISET